MTDQEGGVSITLTPSQLAEILASVPPLVKGMADLTKAAISDPMNEIEIKRAEADLAQRFALPVEVLRTRMPQLYPQIWHSGGGIYLLRINLADIERDAHLLIDESEERAGFWRVGAYLDDGDETVELADPVGVYFLAPTISRLSEVLKEAAKPEPATFADVTNLIIEGVNNGELHDTDTHMAGRTWEAQVVAGPFAISYMPEGDGLRTQSVVAGMRIIMATHAVDQEQVFMVYWHDGVVNEWFENFPTYREAIDYLGDLIKAIISDRHIDEVRPREPELPSVLAHFKDKHPGQEDYWRVRMWWDDPQVTIGVVAFDDETNQTALKVDYGMGSGGGDAGPDTSYICEMCDADLSLILDLDLLTN